MSVKTNRITPTRFAVAVVEPPGWMHSECFREVAQTLDHALRALGHDSVQTDRFDLDDRRIIVLQPMLIPWLSLEPPSDPIMYNLEIIFDESPWLTPKLLDLFRRYPLWDYSQANIDRLAALGIPRPTHVPIGYVPELTRIAPAPEDIDVLFYGALSPRRRMVLDQLSAQGLVVKWLFNVYGASRDAWIARSKLVLNLHQYEAQVFEMVRVSYLLANKRAVVCERSVDSLDELGLESGIAFADYVDLVERARRELGQRGYQVFSARSQPDFLRSALSGV